MTTGNYRLDIEYDGHAHYGWQRQTETDNTIQQKIEDALQVLLKNKVVITGSGRTDSGVSAVNQVANFKTNYAINDNIKFARSLNALLPKSITIKQISEAPSGFNARHSAKSREYYYQITKKRRSLFSAYYYHVPYNLNLDLGRELIRTYLGEHSFKSLCRNTEDKHNFKCNVKRIDLRETKDTIIVEIEASRFLHSMVRAIVGSIIDVSRSKLDLPSTIQKFNNQKKIDCIFVPANALFLKQIHY